MNHDDYLRIVNRRPRRWSSHLIAASAGSLALVLVLVAYVLGGLTR